MHVLSPETPELMLGLRFARSQRRVLTALVQRAEAGELTAAAELFRKAAHAAGTGEPLIIVCQTRDEAVAMADGFVMYGVKRPVIEQLNGL